MWISSILFIFILLIMGVTILGLWPVASIIELIVESILIGTCLYVSVELLNLFTMYLYQTQ